MNMSGISSSSIKVINHPQDIEFQAHLTNSHVLSSKYQSTSANEAEQLVNQLDQLFGYRKTLNSEQQKQVNCLFEKIDSILESNMNAGPTRAQQQQLDQLFDEIDTIYQARSFESLSSQEQKIVDRLLDQLDVALA
ncbi:hypothetical protein imdm_735 [gamma proteobacterium IMCC2047]|nr:hypothetical protein imdm_735 [gamma proteobacterium IMCC2047]